MKVACVLCGAATERVIGPAQDKNELSVLTIRRCTRCANTMVEDRLDVNTELSNLMGVQKKKKSLPLRAPPLPFQPLPPQPGWVDWADHPNTLPESETHQEPELHGEPDSGPDGMFGGVPPMEGDPFNVKPDGTFWGPTTKKGNKFFGKIGSGKKRRRRAPKKPLDEDDPDGTGEPA